jgi:hypothetical protein
MTRLHAFPLLIATLALGTLPLHGETATTSTAPSVAPATMPANLVANGGFEDGKNGWSLFIPTEAKTAAPAFNIATSDARSGQNAARLHTAGYARYGLNGKWLPVKPGQRYRVTAWFKGDSDARAQPGTAGFVVRVTLRNGKSDTPGGHYFLLADGRKSRGGTPPPVEIPFPKKWTSLTSSIEIPGKTDGLILCLFCWLAKGSITIDDVSIVPE